MEDGRAELLRGVNDVGQLMRQSEKEEVLARLHASDFPHPSYLLQETQHKTAVALPMLTSAVSVRSFVHPASSRILFSLLTFPVP